MADYMPVEILELIFQNLTNLSDIHACSSVCSQWHRAARPIISSIPTPLLYLSPLTIPDAIRQHYHTLVTLYCNKNPYTTYDIILPHSLTQSKNPYITHKGWFLYSDDPKNVFLYNPLSRKNIKLPQILKTNSAYDEVQFVTSSAPTKPNCTILAYFKFQNGSFRFDFCTPGDDNWTSVFVSDEVHGIHDMIYYNGYFYAIDSCGLLVRFDLSARGPRIVATSARIEQFSYMSVIYLAESPSKDLILVCREHSCVRVYKMNWGRCYWEWMSNFGDGESIFLARSDSIFIKTDDYQSDCIYFFDESWGGNGGSHNDFGFYNMESGLIEKVDMISSSLFYRWLV